MNYYGVRIPAALAVYDTDDIKSAWFDLREELPKLRDRHQRVINLFTEHSCAINDLDSWVDLLRDEKLRVKFTTALKDFYTTLETILPRPEALPYVKAAKQLGLIKNLLPISIATNN